MLSWLAPNNGGRVGGLFASVPQIAETTLLPEKIFFTMFLNCMIQEMNYSNEYIPTLSQ